MSVIFLPLYGYVATLIPAKNRAWFICLKFLHLARFLRCQRGLAHVVILLLKSPHRAFLGLARGELRQKEEGR